MDFGPINIVSSKPVVASQNGRSACEMTTQRGKNNHLTQHLRTSTIHLDSLSREVQKA